LICLNGFKWNIRVKITLNKIISGKMKEYSKKDDLDQTIDEIISELPLIERVSFANMEKENVDTLQHVFDLYVRNKVDPEDEEYANIMNELWEKLQKTHRVRLVK